MCLFVYLSICQFVYLWTLDCGFFCWTLVIVSWQASCSSLVMKLDFYKPTVLKVHPPISRITAHATIPGRLKHSIISSCFRFFIQMNGAWKMVSSVGVWTPYLSVMTALTTKPQLFACHLVIPSSSIEYSILGNLGSFSSTQNFE